MNFATWSIRQPIPAIVAFLLLCVAGLFGFSKLGIQDLPDLEFPRVTITATLDGASPSQLETQVTRKIEDAMSSVNGVKHISSTVTDGVSSTRVDFEVDKNLFEALNDVRATISNIRADLPADMREPVVSKVDTAGQAILMYSVASPVMTEEQLSWFVDNTVTRELMAIPGVSRLGGVNREIRIALDPTQLAAFNVSAAEVSRQLAEVDQEASGGLGEVSNERQALRTLGTVHRVEDLKALHITLADGRSIRLDQIATVEDTIADRSQLASLAGQRVVCFQVQRARGHGVVEVAEAVRAAVTRLAKVHGDLRFTLVNDQEEIIQEQYKGSMRMLYEGALLAIAVVFLFLRNWRATWISAAALPLSIIPTFGFMHFFGFSLNTVTLLALSLVIGLLVDDTIVEVENIVRHLREGKSPFRAATDAATEIGLAVIATSMALVAVFLPTAFMDGTPGLIFRQFGWTAVVAVLLSLAVARLITPMLGSRFLTAQPKVEVESDLMHRYLALVRWALAHRKTTLAAATVFFVGSLALIPLIPFEFVATTDRSQTRLTLELPPGSSIMDTERTVNRVLVITNSLPEVQQAFTSIGAYSDGNPWGGAGGSEGVRNATFLIQLTPANERQRSQIEVENALRKALEQVPGTRFTLGYGGMGERVQVLLAGDDAGVLKEAATRLTREMRDIPGLDNVTSSAALMRPEIVITLDEARAADMGVTTSTIAKTVRVATAGDYDPALAKFDLPDRQLDIRVMLARSARQDIEEIKSLKVPGRYGLVPLSAVANVDMSAGAAEIDRYDRSRYVVVSAELGGLHLGDVNRMIGALPVMQHLPAGVHRISAGETESMMELMKGFAIALVTGALCVYLVLVLLFKDFAQPATIMVALPLSLGGAFTGLLLANSAMSLPAMIGLVLLMGLASKNSILLVEYAVVGMRDRRLDETEALLDACRKRARPIIMTTLAMVAGMAPVAVGVDPSTSFRAPMAVAVMGGLLSSTVLSLVVIPVVFTYVLHVSRFFSRFAPATQALHGEAAKTTLPARLAVPASYFPFNVEEQNERKANV
jgi:multidrug efflux pump subunit AcrB